MFSSVPIDWSVKTAYNFEHFKGMPDNNAVVWLNSKEEIPKLIDQYVYKSNTINEDSSAIKWFNIMVESSNNASHLIYKFLIN